MAKSIDTKFMNLYKKSFINLKKIGIYGRCFQVIPIIIYCIILNYYYNLKKKNCTCSGNIKRYTLIILTIILVVLSLVVLIFGPINILRFMYSNFSSMTTAIFRSIILFTTIVYFLMTISYIDNLKMHKCECSLGKMSKLILYYSEVVIFFIFLAFVLTFVFLFVNLHNMQAKSLGI